MKKNILLISILIIVSCKKEKIGFIDNVVLMDKYKEKIDIEANFNLKVDNLSKKRDSISQAFQIEAQEFQIKAQKMSQKKAQEEYSVIQQKGQFIGKQLQLEEEELQSAGQAKMDSLVDKVKKEIVAYGKTNGYSYILGGGNGGSVLFGMETNDLTDEILKILNDNYNK